MIGVARYRGKALFKNKVMAMSDLAYIASAYRTKDESIADRVSPRSPGFSTRRTFIQTRGDLRFKPLGNAGFPTIDNTRVSKSTDPTSSSPNLAGPMLGEIGRAHV